MRTYIFTGHMRGHSFTMRIIAPKKADAVRAMQAYGISYQYLGYEQ